MLPLNFYTIVCLFIGFVFGIYYWRLFFQVHCPRDVNEHFEKMKFSFYEHFPYRTRSTCFDYQSKLVLTIGILSSFERLTIYLPSIIETWASRGTHDIEIVLFLEEKSLFEQDFLDKYFSELNQNQYLQFCFYVVQLKSVENTYPPQKKSFYALKYLSIFYSNRSHWFLRLDDNAYVDLDKLLPWLTSLDSRQLLYIGQGGTGRRNATPIHFPPGELFCMGGSGVILSQPALTRVAPWLDQCLKSEILTQHEDVELGRCILTHVRISCTKAYDSKNFFYHHYGPGYEFGRDLTSMMVSQAMIIHPIKKPSVFKQIFLFYLRKRLIRRDRSFQSKVKSRRNYVTFLTRIEFNVDRDIQYQSIDARWKSFLHENIHFYSEHIRKSWSKVPTNWSLTHSNLFFGYHRMIPTYALESIVDVQLHAHSTVHHSPLRFAFIQKRLHIRQRFSPIRSFDYREIEISNDSSRLNLIAVAYNKDQALQRFVNNFQTEINSNDQLFSLTILYFLSNNQTNHTEFANQHSNIHFLFENQTFNRGLARQLASKYFTQDQLLFFVDVDLSFTRQALERTRRLLIHQLPVQICFVYFPIVYSDYSTQLNSSAGEQGLFSIYGFGNVAMKKQDLDRIGGWEINNFEWGHEDVNLFRRFHQYSNECSIFRTVEPDLKHIYHRKMCTGIVDQQRKQMCIDADRSLLASQRTMSHFLLNSSF